MIDSAKRICPWFVVICVGIQLSSLVVALTNNEIGNDKMSKMSDPQAYTDNSLHHRPFRYNDTIPPNILYHEMPQTSTNKPGLPLDPNDFSQAVQLNDVDVMLDQPDYRDPIMIAGLFQGDIQIRSREELFYLNSHATVDTKGGTRNAVKDNDQLWPHGILPYQISSSYDGNERAVIAKAISEIHRFTCIRFVPHRSEADYIFITKSSGCSSAVGRTGGKQTVSLGSGCVYFGIVIHELMHAIGFWHEQSRADRDDNVYIFWSNIQSGLEYNFQKYTWDIIQNLDVSYDTDSIMHYGENAFAKDRSKPTISAKNGSKIGQRNNFSQKDVKKINSLYSCGNEPKPTKPQPPGPAPPKPVPPKPEPPKPIVPGPEACVDHHEFCAEWARGNECAKNPIWMHPNCRKSCNQCNKCNDYNEFCYEWSLRGECYISADYMSYHCKKSCKLCEGGGVTPCTDDNEHCAAWAAVGECLVNPAYMLKFCKLSCKTC